MENFTLNGTWLDPYMDRVRRNFRCFVSQLLGKSVSLNFLNNLVKDVKVNNLTAVSLSHAEATKEKNLEGMQETNWLA